MGKIKKAKKVSQNIDSIYARYLLYGLVALLVLTPFWKGVFVERDQLMVNLFIGIIFLFYFIKGYKRPISLPDVLFAVFVVINFSSIIIGANKWLSIQGALNYLGLFMVYLLFAEIAHFKKENFDVIFRWIYIAGVIVAIFGLFSALTGTNVIDRAFEGGRMGSTFSYANTLAAYLAAVIMIGLMHFEKIESKSTKVIIQLSNYILLVGLYCTQSRGGFITFLLILTLLFIVNWRNWQEKNLIGAKTIQIIIGLGTGVVFINQINAGENLFALLVLFIGSGFIIVIDKILNKYQVLRAYSSKAIIPMIALAAIISIIKDYRILIGLLGRIVNISPTDVDIYHRLVFYKDSLDLIGISPLIGHGSGGWEAMYKIARSLPYYTTQVHNNLLEITIESGILGLLFFLVPSILVIKRSIFNKSNKDTLLAGIIAIGLFVHGIMDFDFSYAAIGIIYWSMLGLITGNLQVDGRSIQKYQKAVLTFCIIFVVVISSLLLSVLFNDKITTAQEQGDLDLMLNYAEKAAIFNPFAEKTRMNIANIYFNKYANTNNIDFMKKALDNIDKAIAFDRYQSDWYATKANYLAFIGDKTARDYYMKAIEINRFDGSEYADAANIELLLAKKEILENGNASEGKSHLLKAIEVENMAIEQENEVPDNYPWRSEARISRHPKLTRTLGYVYIYLDNNAKAREYFELAKEFDYEPMEWAELIITQREHEAKDDTTIAEIEEAKEIIEAVLKEGNI